MRVDGPWDAIIRACEGNAVLSGTVTSTASGGVIVDIGLPAFLPADQTDLRPIGDPGRLVGQRLEVRVVRYDRRTQDLVVSRRCILEEQRDALRAATLPLVREGAILDGCVFGVADYGAIVDVGGIHGFIHVTQLGVGALNNLVVGERVRVVVARWVPEADRLELRLLEKLPPP